MLATHKKTLRCEAVFYMQLALQCKKMVRDAGLEPASLTAKEPKSFVFAISPAALKIKGDQSFF